ncbi:MAG: 50S ribosomal protein L15, partial [Planctomycetota bacterium]
RSRSGDNPRIGFEGGQMPLYRLVPKRGFTNARFRKVFTIVNVGDLARFPAGSEIDLAAVLDAGLSRNRANRLKVLGVGDLTQALVVRAQKFSRGAREKIEAAGGTVVELD